MLLRTFRIALFILLLPPALRAQSTTDTALISRIKTEAFQHSSLPQLAYELIDLCGPRLTNSPGYRKAVSWSVGKFKDWQITAAPEAWGEYGKGWSNEAASLHMTLPYNEPLIAYSVPWTQSTKGEIRSQVVLLDRFDSASIDKWGDALKGKIVMVRKRDSLEPAFLSDAWRYADSDLVQLKDHSHLTNDAIAGYKIRLQSQYNTKLYLEKKGALALLNGKGRDGTVFVSANNGFAKGFEATLPEMILTTESYLKMQRFIEHGQAVELAMNVRSQVYTDDLTGYNVVAEIPGSDPALKNEVVIIGAHLDSWTAATGATDNGAGCIVMMEVARILKTLHLQPKRTIRIILWGGEEEVIRGSVGYVRKHFGEPATMKLKPEQAKVSAYYNLDNGTGKIRGIYSMGNDSAKKWLTAFLTPFADMNVTTVTDRYSGGSDQESLYAVGIPAFAFIQDPLDYDTRTHHTNMDAYERLAMSDLQQCAAVITGVVYQTAMMPQKMPRKALPAAGAFPLTNGLLPDEKAH